MLRRFITQSPGTKVNWRDWWDGMGCCNRLNYWRSWLRKVLTLSNTDVKLVKVIFWLCAVSVGKMETRKCSPLLLYLQLHMRAKTIPVWLIGSWFLTCSEHFGDTFFWVNTCHTYTWKSLVSRLGYPNSRLVKLPGLGYYARVDRCIQKRDNECPCTTATIHMDCSWVKPVSKRTLFLCPRLLSTIKRSSTRKFYPL
jgi:hypothetical protein